MNNKKLDQYKGKLTPSQIAEGMNSAIRNAKRLKEFIYQGLSSTPDHTDANPRENKERA